MTNQTWLITWIGAADHECAEAKRGSDLGPIATALLGEKRYDRIYLLTNYDFDRSKSYCTWLESMSNYDSSVIDLYSVDLISPIDYGDIYTQVSSNLQQAGLPRDDVELTFHVSPGTPAMAAIWIILAKTRFPAKLIQTSRDKGVESVDFFFDLASDFLPEYLQRSGERVRRLADTPQLSTPEFGKIIHQSQVVANQISLARRIAVYEVPVLILGETGTGKELFAEAIHAASSRAGQPFVAVNCGAIAPELANSELFGHKKGAFTGASADRKGHFLEASGGTLFLDEVGDLPLDTQVRLLRALQSHEITPMGQSKPIKINTRILAATHRDLAADVAAGRFREDLFHRLAVGILQLPPLRERPGDVELLAHHFLASINADSAGRPEAQNKTITPAALKLLQSLTWPGNIRELYHTLLRAVIWSAGPGVTDQDVQAAVLTVAKTAVSNHFSVLSDGFELRERLDEVARSLINQALRQSGQRKSAAAKLLGFANHQTLANWMKRLGMNSDLALN
ncbi:Transcriptional regulatory protein ZraR [Betaproteobacteria bacterium MOLA814]|nr:Transcriptional regulatory protein ZraR [Betaproteobacteria bacterium MOLA814]